MKLSIATKIFFAFTAVIAVFSVVLVFGIYRTQWTFEQVRTVNATVVPLSLTLSDVQTDLKSFSVLLNERDPLVLRRTLQVTRLAPSVPDRFRRNMELAVDLAKRTDSAQRVSDPVSQRVEALKLDIEAFAVSSQAFTAQVLSESDETLVFEQQTQLREHARKMDSELSSLRIALREITDRALRQAKEHERSSLYGLGVATAVALAIAILLLVAVSLTMRRLTDLTEAAKRIGQGDYAPLSAEDARTPHDEIGLLVQEFDHMARSIADRDQALREQHAKFLKSERLATVGRMTALITHELRNPLSSINLNVEMLHDALSDTELTQNDPELLEQLDTIISEVDRLREITEQYLAYARLPTPRIEAHLLGDNLQSLLDFHAWEWSDAGVQVTLDIKDDFEANFDASQLRQACLNLIKNAVEASPKGTTIDVSFRRDADDAVIMIRDHAGGIPASAVEHIFEPFFTTKKSGTGLGLAMTQQIIEEHGGHIELEHHDDGTTFHLHLVGACA
jgi:two-component system NtrC family sensor kinase